jgi:hypothetical protein
MIRFCSLLVSLALLSATALAQTLTGGGYRKVSASDGGTTAHSYWLKQVNSQQAV